MQHVAVAAALILLSGLTASAQDISTDHLSWLEGTWAFADRALPSAGFEYEESGTRDCRRVLDGRYIQCTSHGMSGPQERTYIHYWTWNEQAEQVEMLSLFGNLPTRELMTGTLSGDGHRLNLTGAPYEGDGETYVIHHEIRYNGTDTIVWQSRRAPEGEMPDPEAVRFEDVAVRQ